MGGLLGEEREISKEKQIEEMANIVSNAIKTWFYKAPPTSNPHFVAAAIYKEGYRKQKEGENVSGTPSLFECSVCHWYDWDTTTGDTSDYNYCPNCGAKMKGV